MKTIIRCDWAGNDPLMQHYHDHEWGKLTHDDREHFELMVLEGAQAGLSWRTVLHRREGYRQAYRDFDPAVVANFADADSSRLLGDSGIIRNRAKVASSINNARHFLELQREFGSFDAYIWSFVGAKPIDHRPKHGADIPATSPESDALSLDLRHRSFTFVGSTICYAHLQSAGLINDHLVTCSFRA